MTIQEIQQSVQKPEYDFLKTNPHLGNNIILLGLGGSRAYGTHNENSDWDWRGIATRTAREILTGRDFEQVVNTDTDTTIYSFNKMIGLLANCNPNTIEILGLKPEHYLYVSPVGEALLDNADMFLSKRAFHTFGSYASSQLRRLCNKAVRDIEQEKHEAYILRSIQNASHDFPNRYAFHPEDAVKLFLDKSEQEDMEAEIFMDLDLKHYPLRDWCSMWNEMQSIVRSYNKVGMRNSKAIEHGKLGKHQMHLARLYLMAFDILEDGEIITYREKDHDFLMDIRAGKYLTEEMLPTPEFMQMVDEWEARLQKAVETSELPDRPDMDRIQDFVADVNSEIVAAERNVMNIERGE